MSSPHDKPIYDKTNEVTLLRLWKDEMVRRLENEAVEAIRPKVRQHAIEVVESMNMAAQKDFDFREQQLVVKLFGKVDNSVTYEEVK